MNKSAFIGIPAGIAGAIAAHDTAERDEDKLKAGFGGGSVVAGPVGGTIAGTLLAGKGRRMHGAGQGALAGGATLGYGGLGGAAGAALGGGLGALIARGGPNQGGAARTGAMLGAAVGAIPGSIYGGYRGGQRIGRLVNEGHQKPVASKTPVAEKAPSAKAKDKPEPKKDKKDGAEKEASARYLRLQVALVKRAAGIELDRLQNAIPKFNPLAVGGGALVGGAVGGLASALEQKKKRHLLRNILLGAVGGAGVGGVGSAALIHRRDSGMKAEALQNAGFRDSDTRTPFELDATRQRGQEEPAMAAAKLYAPQSQFGKVQ